MKINGYIGDARYSIKKGAEEPDEQGIGDIKYINKQKVSYFYVISRSEDDAVRALNDIPVKSPYDTIESTQGLKQLYPKNGLILMDYYKNSQLQLISDGEQYGIMTTPSENYINAISIYKKEIWYKPKADGSTVLDAFGRPIPVVEAVEENNWHLVTDKTESDIVYDFNVGNNRYYKYLYRFVYAGVKGGKDPRVSDVVLIEGLKEIIVPIKVGWTGWSLTELHEVENTDGKVYQASLKDVWKFKYNISPGDFTQNLAKTAQETLAQFPKFIHGPKNNISSTVSCLLGRDVVPFDWTTLNYKYESTTGENNTINWNWDGAYGGTGYNAGGYKEELWPDVYYSDLTSNKQMDMLNHWQNFCFSGNPKLLRDNQGHRYIVHVHDASSHVEETWQGRPITISFSWTQIKNANDAVIVEEI